MPVAAAALSCALAPASASAAAPPAGQGPLSPRLAALAKPAVRSLPPARQARTLSLARSGPGSLLRRGNRVVVEVRFERGAAAGADPLRAAGGQVLDVSRRYQTVTVAAKPSQLRAIARVPRVRSVKEVLTPILFGTESSCPQGVAVSEGDEQLRAAEAREAFGVDGEGVTVGILSDSFDQASEAADGSGPVATRAWQDVVSGDLPGSGNPCGQTTPVDVLENDLTEPGKEAPVDEGRGMAQIVHDLAPGAKLAFASAFNGEAAFAGNIERLAKPASEGGAGAQVIADDVGYFEEPFFQDGPIADAINRVTSKGVDYFTAAGNDNLIEEPEPGVENEIGSWEAPKFRDAGECPTPLVLLSGEYRELEEAYEAEHPGTELPDLGLNAEHCMDFNPSESETDDTFGITVEEGATLIADLQWAEPWEGVETDLDAFLIDSAGEVVGESVADNVAGGRPVEVVGWENTGPEQEVQLVVNNYTGEGEPRLKFILLESGVSKIEYPTSEGADTVGPTIFGHAGAASAISVGAVPFNTDSEPEYYSSRGPVTHYFGPVEAGPVESAPPAPALSSPEALTKPDIAATDCGVTTFFAEFGRFSLAEEPAWHFCGTSAAAPHAAAVAALMRQANPGQSPEQVRSVLASTARPVGSFGPDAVGSGLVDAFHAVAAVAGPPTIAITERPAPLSRDRSPSFAFAASRPVSFACSLDGTPSVPCTTPYKPAPLADGRHGFVVTGVDAAGSAGTSETVLFTIDTTPPRVLLLRHPRRLVRTRHRRARVVFRFGASERRVAFLCRLGGHRVHRCRRRVVWRLGPGRRVLRVWARDAAGNVSRRPAVFRFRVKRIG